MWRKLISAWVHLLSLCYYPFRLRKFGRNSIIAFPLKLDGCDNIEIGTGVSIAYKTWLASVSHTGHIPLLSIGDGCAIGHFNHIYATKSIVLEKNVLTADKVYISDNMHDYRNITVPIKNQGVVQKGEVVIGEGAWLGENVCVIGAKVGKHCVIGANSVVTKDIPDYSVAVGAPARVIKRFNFDIKQWENVTTSTSIS